MQAETLTKRVDGFSIDLSKRLGKCSFGEVYIGTHIETQLKFAVKMIPMDLIQEKETLTKLIKRENFKLKMSTLSAYFISQELSTIFICSLIYAKREISKVESKKDLLSLNKKSVALFGR